MFIVAFRVVLTHSVISKTVENFRVRRYFGVEQDVSGGNAEVCACGNLEARGEVHIGQRNAIEGYWKP